MGIAITHNLSEMLVPLLEMRNPEEPLQTVRRDGCLEISHVTTLHMKERFPRPHHAFPSLDEVFSFTTHPVMLDPEFGGEETGIKVRINSIMRRDEIKHEENNFRFGIGNCLLFVNVARMPSQIIREGKPTEIDFDSDEIPVSKGNKNPELFKRVLNEVFVRNPGLEVVQNASFFHKFAAGNLEELMSVERDREWKAEMPCMKVKFYPALVVR